MTIYCREDDEADVVQAPLPGVGEPRAPTQTVRGYALDEVKSALQKAIRRGQEEAAMYWAKELVDSGRAEALWKRLQIIAVEDCAGMSPIDFVSHCAQAAAKCKEPLIFGLKAAVELARCAKDRTVDEYIDWHNYRLDVLHDDSVLLKIPDEALGMHTRRGRRLGRGRADFYHVGAMLVNESPQYDKRYLRFLKEHYPLSKGST